MIVLAAALVLAPGTPLGLLTNAVQALAGVLLPSATVFLLLLCNDRAVLGPWVNSRGHRGRHCHFNFVVDDPAVVVLFPGISEGTVMIIFVTGTILAVGVIILVKFLSPAIESTSPVDDISPATLQRVWRMPPLDQLAPARLTVLERMWLCLLRVYLVVAAGLVLVRIVMLATVGT